MSPAAATTASPYLCDTLPPPRLASESAPSTPRSRSPAPVSHEFDEKFNHSAGVVDNAALQWVTKPAEEQMPMQVDGEAGASAIAVQPPARKLCVRHQRMADEGTNLKLQQALDALPVEEREAVNAVWSNFSSSSHPRRALILQGLLTMCCFSQLSLLSEQLSHLIRLDPFAVLPREVALRILGYLDATSLCRAAQVSRTWRSLADDDILWRGICEQHIGQKCLKCGWGLPILERRRTVRALTSSPSSSPAPFYDIPALTNKRDAPYDGRAAPPSKRQRCDSVEEPSSPEPSGSGSGSSSGSSPHYLQHTLSPPHHLQSRTPHPHAHAVTRPWKDVYCERLRIERNWRRGRCTVRTLKGHTDGVMCLQFNESLAHPAFPVLITGSYDRTARVWNLETGTEVHCLTGHTRAVRALQFDEAKLITGSMDNTMKVWNWRTGQCLRTLEGHTEGVVCLNFDDTVLASGSVDTTIKVWNLKTGECFTLRGHCDWVNAVQLWDANSGRAPAGHAGAMFGTAPVDQAPACGSPLRLDAGKMLFSASDDGTIRLWDLALRSCVRLFKGHIGQVQSLKLLLVDEDCAAADPTPAPARARSQPATFSPPASSRSPLPLVWRGAPEQRPPSAQGAGDHQWASAAEAPVAARRRKPVLISGSLDNTIKLWDVETGKATKTLFGHIEGVWAVASDKLRLVSGSHDRTIKVWVREEGRCMATLVGHRGAVTCLALGEDKIVSGSDDGDVRLWNFSI